MIIPKAVSVSIEKLGKLNDLGNRICDDVDDYSGFSVYFGNILYKNVKYHGKPVEFPVIIKKHSDIHTLEHINAVNCDFTIEGRE